MRKELENIRLIEAYLRNDLSAEEQKNFENQISQSQELQQQVETQQLVLRGIERIGVRESIETARRIYYNRRKGLFLGLLLLVIVAGVFATNYFSSSESPGNNTKKGQVHNLSKNDKDTSVVKNPPKRVTADTVSTKTVEKKMMKAPTEELEEKDDIQDIEAEKSEHKLKKDTRGENDNELVQIPQKQFQYFTINTKSDTSVTCEEGTVINFNANSFKTQADKLNIRVKEYYDNADIVFSSLTTETFDGEMLETGGMIFIDAMADGKQTFLKVNNAIEVKFPCEEKKEDMQLFLGEEKEDIVKWEKAEQPSTPENKSDFSTYNGIYSVVEEMPNFKGGREKLMEYLNKNIKYPKEAKKNNIKGKVYVGFVVNEGGEVVDVNIERGVHPLLDQEALRVVKNSPPWIPGKQRGRAVKTYYTLPINFDISGGSDDKDYPEEKIKRHNDSLQRVRDSLQRDRIYKVIDSPINESESTKISDSEKPRDVNQNTNINFDINNYVLSSGNLGWINCDRFKKFQNKINADVKLEKNERVNVKMIFHSVKGIMAGYQLGETISFFNIPANEKVTIFALKYVNGAPHVCIKEVTTSKEAIELEFEKLTKERLDQIIEQMNKI